MGFLSTHLFNGPMESTNISYFLHLHYSEQRCVGGTLVRSGTAPHWCVVMCHWASCYPVLSFMFQLAQAEQHPSRPETKDKASAKRSVIGPGLAQGLEKVGVLCWSSVSRWHSTHHITGLCCKHLCNNTLYTVNKYQLCLTFKIF